MGTCYAAKGLEVVIENFNERIQHDPYLCTERGKTNFVKYYRTDQVGN